MSNLPLIPQPEADTTVPIISKPWALAWEEFGRSYPRLKHGPAFIAFFLFTFLGQSILGIIAYFYGFPVAHMALNVSRHHGFGADVRNQVCGQSARKTDGRTQGEIRTWLRD